LRFPVLLSAVVAAALVTGGCATKKHVREAIAPVQTQVNDVQKQTAENKTAIGDLDRSVATADEKAVDAGKRAKDAADAAAKANDAAMQAGQRADSARTLAEQTGTKLQALDQTVQNLDNYKLVETDKVMFKLGKSNLTKDAKEELDAAVQKLGGLKTFVIEVEGYTDRSGGKTYNLTLSENRADSVVRYLTTHDVPLRKIHKVGVGSEIPNADNSTREARKENRRVDLRVYQLDTTKTQSASSQPSNQ